MKGIIFIIILLQTIDSFAQTITVKQDSTGDFIHIQNAINSSNDSDTVLVWPGTYSENVVLNGKNITLASLFLTLGDSSYKQTTIIDGSMEDACISIVDYETNVLVYGLTLQHGSDTLGQFNWSCNGGGIRIGNESVAVEATISDCIIMNNQAEKGKGGGVYIYNSTVDILNCKILNNNAIKSGGGVYCRFSNLFLSNTDVIGNFAQKSGGGLFFTRSEITMDSINRCNVYLNYSANSNDFGFSGIGKYFNFIVDTFTVVEPAFLFNYGHMFEDTVDLDILHGKIEPYDGDLFVDPVNGNNDNSGTSTDSALKTIVLALTKIKVDSLKKNTIHLANGIYSDTANNEKLPLNLRPFINIKGESMEGVILDGRYKTLMLRGNWGITDYSMKNLTLWRGQEADYERVSLNTNAFGKFYWENENIVFDSLIIDDARCYQGEDAFGIYASSNVKISNSIFKNIVGERALNLATWNFEDSIWVNNCKFENNQYDPDHPNHLLMGGGIRPGGASGIIVINNSLFNNNSTNTILGSRGQLFVNNCTFADNPLPYSFYFQGSNLHVYNSIFTGNNMPQIYIGPIEGIESVAEFHNSLIEGGEEEMYIAGETILHYDETNTENDPIFLNLWGDPYMISDGSPCIDAGTLAKLPSFLRLPDKDLAGNPRIVGDSIDMGAYEWNPTIVGFNDIGPNANKKESLLKAWPNPFSWETTIVINNRLGEKYEVEIYDNYGKLVKYIISTSIKGKEEILWYGDDNNGNPMPAGIYHVVMFSGEREVESLKLVKK